MKKLSKEVLQEYIDKHYPGGKVIGVYINTSIPIKIQCNKKHTWMVRPNDIKNKGSWCPYCSGRLGHKLEDLQTYIEKHHHGALIRSKYVNEGTKVEIQCNKNSGHVWMATPSKIKRGRWCPICAGTRRKDIRSLQNYINKNHNGGKIIGNYNNINNRTLIEFKCNKNPNHQWETTSKSIRRGSWCPFCIGKVGHSKEELQDYIDKNHSGGQVIGKYVNHSTKTRFKCKCGNTWETTPTNIMTRGSWCMQCSGKAKSNTDEFQKYIDENHPGGTVLEEYIDALTKIKIRCAYGHIWKVAPGYVKHGQWCPVCSQGSSERICRKTFELIFDKDFSKRRPKWLVNPETSRKMELDGFCKELGLAFEYNGKQHYEKIEKFFHKNQGYEKQVERDILKGILCKKNDVVLIIVPYWIEKEDFPRFI